MSVYKGNAARARTFPSVHASCATTHSYGRLYAVAETQSRVWGDGVGALAPKKIFCRPPQSAKFGGTAGKSLFFFNSLGLMFVQYIYAGNILKPNSDCMGIAVGLNCTFY